MSPWAAYLLGVVTLPTLALLSYLIGSAPEGTTDV